MIAIGAIKALYENGLKVPDDIGIVGFDDIYMATVVTPNLTTICQPKYMMRYKAAQMLIELFNSLKLNQKR